jgi:predicted dehydrogenase
MRISRRSFLASAIATGAFPYISLAGSAFGKKDKVRLACVGIGQQAWNDIVSFEKTGHVEIAALCDTDLKGKQCVKALKRYKDLPRFTDFRKMLDSMEKKIDAVAVMTPDFSHFPATIDAMRRKLPVFVEKPLAHTFEECELLMKAEQKYSVACQMANQGHSGKNYYQFKHYVENGIIDVSKLTKLVAHMNNPRRWHKWNGKVEGWRSGEKMPAGLDWDTWIGTAEYRDYSKDYVQGEWRCWHDFGCGCLGDWGAHTMDTMHRFFDLGLPEEVVIKDVKGWNKFVFPMQDTLIFKFAAKGKRPKIDLEWYEGLKNLPQLPNGYKYLSWGGEIPTAKGSTAKDANKLIPGKFFYMADGTVWEGASHSSPILRCGEDNSVEPYPEVGSDHYANFLLSVKGEEKTRSPFAVAAPLSQMFCLGCIAQRLNRSFKFDTKTKTIIGDDEANALLFGPPNTPRKGWEEFYKI